MAHILSTLGCGPKIKYDDILLLLIFHYLGAMKEQPRYFIPVVTEL